jgi:anti-anti-sigma regulatory factor
MTPHGTIGLEHHSAELSIVELGGRLDNRSRPEVAEALARAGERRNVVVDLSGADHVAPSVVNAVVQSAERLTGRRARLELVIPARAHALRSLFETVGPAGIAAVHETRSGAITALAPAAGIRPSLRSRRERPTAAPAA